MEVYVIGKYNFTNKYQTLFGVYMQHFFQTLYDCYLNTIFPLLPCLVVLSSEEEEEEGEEGKEVEASSLNIQPLEGAKDMDIEDKSVRVYKQKKHLSVIHTQVGMVIHLLDKNNSFYLLNNY